MEQLVQLPPELKMLLGLIFTALTTQALKWLGDRLDVNLTGYVAQVTASLVGAVLVFLNALLSQIPAEAAPIANQLFALAVVVLGSFGFYKAFLKKE